MKFDISKFKKVRDSKDHAVLMHPDGHQITISKAALSPKLKAQLAEMRNHMAEGGVAEPDSAPEESLGRNPMTQLATIAEPVQQQPQPQVVEHQPEIKQPVGPQNIKIPQAQQPGMANQMMASNQNYAQQLQQGYGQVEQGLHQQVAAQQRLGRSEAQAASAYDNDLQTVRNNYQQTLSKLNGEISHTIKDIDAGHIDPNHYINDKSTLGKVSTAIGLILGGVSGGLTHQENPALKFLNAQIDRDIQSQQMNLNKKQGMLSAYFHQMGNLNDATAMTKAFYIDHYSNMIKKAMAENMSPQAQAAGAQALGQLQIQKANALGPLALKQSVLTSNVDPSVKINLLAPENEKMHLYKDLEELQNMSGARDEALKAFDTLSKINTVGSRVPLVGSPLQTSKQVEAITEPIILKLARDAAGRVNEYELPGIRSLFPRPGDNSETINKKYEQLQEFLKTKMHKPSLVPYGISAPAPRPRSINSMPQR